MDLGSHCSHPACARLDFLPFACSACHAIYCLDHRHPQTHGCEKWEATDRALPVCPLCKNILKVDEDQDPATYVELHQKSGCIDHVLPARPSAKIPCSFAGCTVAELWASKCRRCGSPFCLNHRHPPDHSCPNIELDAKAAQDKKTAIQQLISDKIQPGAPTAKLSPPVKKAKRSSPAVELMRLKMHAKGDSSVPADNRVYFRAFFPLERPQPSLPLYFHRDWNIGKVLDKIADAGRVSNFNNSQPDKKLSLFNVEGQALPTSSSLKALIASKSIQNGSILILERTIEAMISPDAYQD
ncbi:uncharacterized protein BJ171DRAFT_528916 [Polychytrium aggregatum]|uniref:uncharacterized protein n=1 Tax=Polychytrium aggregatum TaxID=110093 RepID=UPI0022FEC1CA|nr:uncharacterized protein BJ171DRAFT_528916 [Polychytrium aggregatum]KAI9193329.1 hypothetical protein BJ171DRAFT_528916 [Polychytrium aggregatum]